MGGYVLVDNGSLEIVERAVSTGEVQTALAKLDRKLFLTFEIDPDYQARVWRVHYLVSTDRPAVHVMDWRTPQGAPLPLTMRLVDRVSEMEREAGSSAAIAAENNRQMIEGLERDAQAEELELAEDMLPRMSGTRSAVLHRGHHLRQARDRQRRAGGSVQR